MPVTCENCGQLLADDAKSCPICGTELKEMNIRRATLPTEKQELIELLGKAETVFAKVEGYLKTLRSLDPQAAYDSYIEKNGVSVHKRLMLIPVYIVGRRQRKAVEQEAERCFFVTKERYDKVFSEMFSYIKENLETISIIPGNYKSSDACGYFKNALADGRAFTLLECMLLYDDHIYERTTEVGQFALYVNQRERGYILDHITSRIAAAERETDLEADMVFLSLLF